jgi:hypothetical protein
MLLIYCSNITLQQKYSHLSKANFVFYLPTYLPTYLSIYLWLCSPFWDLYCFLGFLILYTVGRTPWTGDQPVARPLRTCRTTQTQNKRIQTSMTWVGFESTIPAFERGKTVHALDGSATVIGAFVLIRIYKINKKEKWKSILEDVFGIWETERQCFVFSCFLPR